MPYMDDMVNDRALAQQLADARGTRGLRVYDAVIANTLTNPDQDLFVLLPYVDGGRHRYGPCRWLQGTGLPAEGDAALYTKSTDGEEWVVVWWPDGVSGPNVNDLETRVEALEAVTCGFYMRLENDVASAFTNNATSKVPMDTAIYESHPGMIDLTNDWATIPAGMDGWWSFDAGALQTAAFTVNLTYQTFVVTSVHGSYVLDTYFPSLTSRKVLLGTRVIRVDEGETINAAYFQNSGSNYTADGLAGDFNYLRGVRIGP